MGLEEGLHSNEIRLGIQCTTAATFHFPIFSSVSFLFLLWLLGPQGTFRFLRKLNFLSAGIVFFTLGRNYLVQQYYFEYSVTNSYKIKNRPSSDWAQLYF
jgi:hypothetical protein